VPLCDSHISSACGVAPQSAAETAHHEAARSPHWLLLIRQRIAAEEAEFERNLAAYCACGRQLPISDPKPVHTAVVVMCACGQANLARFWRQQQVLGLTTFA
jgi:hypothetical protein